jgi:hypothetical protein
MRWIGSNENETLRALVVVAVDLNLSLNLSFLENRKRWGFEESEQESVSAPWRISI